MCGTARTRKSNRLFSKFLVSKIVIASKFILNVSLDRHIINYNDKAKKYKISNGSRL